MLKPTAIARRSLLTGLVALFVVGPVLAADEFPSFKKRGDEEKRFVAMVGEAILKVAHPTGKKRALVDYKITAPKAGRSELTIKMEYYGLVSAKKYVADITIKLDSTDPKSWEVLNIDYVDNNNVPANVKKIQELIKDFNK